MLLNAAGQGTTAVLPLGDRLRLLALRRGGAISLLPGGVGANEAGMVGLLVVVGVEPAAAAAIAVLMRLVASTRAVLRRPRRHAAARRGFPQLSSLTAITGRSAGGVRTAWPTAPAWRGGRPWRLLIETESMGMIERHREEAARWL